MGTNLETPQYQETGKDIYHMRYTNLPPHQDQVMIVPYNEPGNPPHNKNTRTLLRIASVRAQGEPSSPGGRA